MAIIFDNGTSSRADLTSTPLSFSHSCGVGANRIAVVFAIVYNASTAATISSVTYGGTAMTAAQAASTLNVGGSADIYCRTYYLLDPPVGSSQVIITPSGTADQMAGCATFFNVDQVSPIGNTAAETDANPATDPSLAITTTKPNSIVIDGVITWTGQTTTPDNSTAWTEDTVISTSWKSIASYKTVASAGATTMDHTITSIDNYLQQGIELIAKRRVVVTTNS